MLCGNWAEYRGSIVQTARTLAAQASKSRFAFECSFHSTSGPRILHSNCLIRCPRLRSRLSAIRSSGASRWIDRSGQIALSHTGVVEKHVFETHIRELLKQDEHPDSQRRQQLP